MAVGVALSPVPIAGVVNVLLSARPANAPAFLLGWIAGFFLFPERVRPALADWKEWLVRNNAGVTTALLVVFGALIIGAGVKIVSA